MAQFDCRALAIISLLLTILIMGGIVIFRHHHGHHIQHRSSPSSEICPECECVENIRLKENSIEQPQPRELYLSKNIELNKIENFQINTANYVDGKKLKIELSEMCLQCICMTATECKPSNCTNGICGIFRISKPYWIDAEKPKMIGDNSENIDENAHWRHCVNNPFCSARTVENYMQKYARDFNGDGIIDCYDYTKLHILGPTGSFKEQLNFIHRTRLNNCLQEFQ